MTLDLSLLWGLLILVVLSMAGQRLGMVLFRPKTRLEAVSVGLFLSLALMILAACYLLPLGNLLLDFGLLLGGLSILKFVPSPPEKPSERLNPAEKAGLALIAFLVVLRSLFAQATGMVVDEDFFIHAANMGLFQRGQFPPLNPFLGEPMNGHFARDLAIALGARYTTVPFLHMEWILTTGFQMLLVGGLYGIWRRLLGIGAAALALVCGLFAANFGAQTGMADTLANNNPIAMLFLILGPSLLFVTLSSIPGDSGARPEASDSEILPAGLGVQTVSALLLTGAIIGLEGVVYEIHYGLIALGLVPVLLLVSEWRKPLIFAFLASAVVVLTAGGPFQDLAARELGLKPESKRPSTTRQQVSMKFPKKELFSIRTDNLRPSRPFEGRWRPYSATWQPEQVYRKFWDRQLMATLWWPAWLLPLLWLGCLAKKRWLELTFASIAACSVLVPATVDFGFFEDEATRWLYTTAVASSLVFGAAFGRIVEALVQRKKTQPLAGLLLVLSLPLILAGWTRDLQDSRWAMSNPGEPLPVGRPGLPPGTGLLPDPPRSLEYHYGLTRDWRIACEYVRKQSQPEDLFAASWQPLQINAKGTIVGWTGLYPLPMQAPPEGSDEARLYKNTEPVEQALAAANAEALKDLGTRWLLTEYHLEDRSPDFLSGRIAVYDLQRESTNSEAL